MSEIYDTHEQGERVKSWLRENGSAIVMGLVLAFGLMFGFKQWQAWDISKRQQASAEYQTLASHLEEENLDAAVPNYEVLKDQYGSSAYTAMASLMMAKARLESGQTDLAISALKHAMENAQPEPVKVIARERLARVLVSEGDLDGAMKLLDSLKSEVGFEAQFADIRGDIYVAQGDVDQAIKSYQSSLAQLEEGYGNRDLLEMKLEALGAEADLVDTELVNDGDQQ